MRFIEIGAVMSDDSSTPGIYEDTKEEMDEADQVEDTVMEEPSLYENLMQRRLEAKKIQDDAGKNVVEGTKVYAVPSSWLHQFMEEEYSAEDPDDKYDLGPLYSKEILDDTGLVLTRDYEFVPSELFQKLCEWYGYAEGNPVVEREVYYNHTKRRLDIEAHPLYIVPHILASNRGCFRVQDCKPFLVSCESSAASLKLEMEHRFEVPASKTAKSRLWQVKSSAPNFPPVVLPSFVETITDRQQITAGRKTGARTLDDKGVTSGHILLELQEPDGTYLMDTASEVILGDGLCGLNNLGNTCYMNSALQCLSHIPELTYFLIYDFYRKDLNKENPLGNGGRIAEAYASLVKHLFDRRLIGHQSSLAPRDFRYTLGHFNPIFSDYRQQDSQEFIAFLLDGLHEDLNRVMKKPYVEKPELSAGKHNDPLAIKQLADECWDAHRKRNDSAIMDLFVGQYKSTLICPTCNNVSITFDPYNDLTLPLPITRKWHHKVRILLEEGEPKSLEVELLRSATFYDLKEYVSKAIDVESNDLICLEIFQSQVYKNYEDKDSDTRYMPIADLITKGDDIWFYQLTHETGDLVVPVFNTVTTSTGLRGSKVFGIPFFITLSEAECRSYGAIREKLEHRYTQLSTYHYFEKVRSQKEYTIDDFPKLDSKNRKLLAKADDDIISLANPDLPGDYAFIIELLGGKKVKPRRSFGSRLAHRMGYHNFTTGGVDEEEDEDDDDNLWVPETNGNFGGLEQLLDRLSPLKRELYTYRGVDEADEDEAGGAEEAADQAAETETETADPAETAETEIAEIADATGADGDINIDDDASDTSSDTSSDSIAIDGIDSPLIEERTALVCEWDPDLFEAFFVGLDNEDGGEETWSHPPELQNEELKQSRQKEAERRNRTINLDDCLELFSKPEVLGEQDLWYCPVCKEHQQATKKIEVWSVPDILTIHLKRFESSRSFSDKIDAVVEFPIEGLDMSGYAADKDQDGRPLIYDLFAVDNHFGGMGGGHYTAYVKDFVDNKWYYYDDSRVTPTDPLESIKGSAYLLFYRRRSEGPLGGEHFKLMEQEIKKRREEQQLRMQELRITVDDSDESDGEGVKRRKKTLSSVPMENMDSPASDREEVMSTVSSTANAPCE